MLAFVERSTSANELRGLIANARRQGVTEVEAAAMKRLAVVEAGDQPDDLTAEFWRSISAYEQLLSRKNGRRTPATRTRQKIDRKGVVQTLEDWALSSQPTEGFRALIDCGLAELTGEAIVLRYRQRFSDPAVKSAAARLRAAGVDPASSERTWANEATPATGQGGKRVRRR